MTTGVLRRQGDDYVVVIPSGEVERLHLEDGQEITVSITARQQDAGAPASMDDTEYLLSSRRNAERLRAALERADRGEGVRMTPEELRAELGLARP